MEIKLSFLAAFVQLKMGAGDCPLSYMNAMWNVSVKTVLKQKFTNSD